MENDMMINGKSFGVQIAQTELFRLSALIFAEYTETDYSINTFLAMIEGIIIANQNEPMTIEAISATSLHKYSLIMLEDEVRNCIAQNATTFQTHNDENIPHYNIHQPIFDILVEKSRKNIEYYINEYIKELGVADDVTFKNAVYHFLYVLTTSNIKTYQGLIGGDVSSTVNTSDNGLLDSTRFTDYERLQISQFIAWDNSEKNAALFNTILCCLEYCLVVAGDKTNTLCDQYITERSVFLDTNIIFRALAINGVNHEKIICSFLKKCNQANIHLIVTPYTKREFFNTVKHYVELEHRYSIDNAYPGIFYDLSDCSVVDYYRQWKNEHPNTPSKLFFSHIDSIYGLLVQEYNIVEESPSFNIHAPEVRDVITRYQSEINNTNQNLTGFDYTYQAEFDNSNQHDAILVYSAESKAQTLRQQGNTQDCLIVTTHRQFRQWDINRRTRPAPIVIFPNQLFAILLKVCGRSTDDIKSFLNFINIKPATHQLTTAQATVIISGIASITADFELQKMLVSSVFNDEFQRIINNSQNNQQLYEGTQEYAQKVIDERINALDAKVGELSQQLHIAQNEIIQNRESETALNDKLAYNDNILDKLRQQQRQMAMDAIKFVFVMKWYILPLLCFILWLGLSVLLLSLVINIWAMSDFALSIIQWYKALPMIKDHIGISDIAIIAPVGLWISMAVYMIGRIGRDKRILDKKVMIENRLNSYE